MHSFLHRSNGSFYSNTLIVPRRSETEETFDRFFEEGSLKKLSVFEQFWSLFVNVCTNCCLVGVERIQTLRWHNKETPTFQLSTSLWGQAASLLPCPAPKRDDQAIFDEFEFCRTILSWGKYVWKLGKFSTLYTEDSVLHLKILIWQILSLKILTKQVSRSKLIGHLNVFWTFSHIFWKQGMKSRAIGHCNDKHTLVYYTNNFICTQKFFDGIFPRNYPIGQFSIRFGSASPDHIGEAPSKIR